MFKVAKNNVLHYKSKSCWETRADGAVRVAVRGVWLKRKQAFHLFTWRENIEGERDQVANHVSPSNYDKASLSRAHSSSRMARPQPEDILVPANTTNPVKKLQKNLKGRRLLFNTHTFKCNRTGACVTGS